MSAKGLAGAESQEPLRAVNKNKHATACDDERLDNGHQRGN